MSICLFTDDPHMLREISKDFKRRGTPETYMIRYVPDHKFLEIGPRAGKFNKPHHAKASLRRIVRNRLLNYLYYNFKQYSYDERAFWIKCNLDTVMNELFVQHILEMVRVA